MNTFQIGRVEVGTGKRTFVIIELGVTHSNDETLAKTMIRAAKEAGADAVKCEVIDPDALVARDYRQKLDYSYTAYSGKKVVERYYDLIKQLTMPRAMIANLKQYADEIGIEFFGTAFDNPSIDFLQSIGCCAIKIASPEITHLPLLAHAAKSGLPVLLDSGRATIAEIETAVRWLNEHGSKAIAVMHNPSGYPAPYADIHLRMIPTLRQRLNIPVGLSCHTRGIVACCGAVGIGADLIEKPVTDDNTQDGDEHIFSLNVDEIAAFVAALRNLDEAKGLADRDPLVLRDSEFVRNTYRQSLVAACDLDSGHRLAETDFAFARPGWGIQARDYTAAIGKRLLRPIARGNVIHWSDVADDTAAAGNSDASPPPAPGHKDHEQKS